MSSNKVLLVGETWISRAIHIKGIDEFSSTTFHNGATDFVLAMKRKGIDIEQLEAHLVPEKFPRKKRELDEYSVIILSDIGSNSLLLSSNVWLKSESEPNAIFALCDWVKSGGSLLMVGGYLSFQGFQGIANYYNSGIESVLPVEMLPSDDRVENPQGLELEFVTDHQILKSTKDYIKKTRKSPPKLLGHNKTKLKPDSELLISLNEDPLLAICEIEKGRSAVWTSDIGPHWCPKEFIDWEGYELILSSLIKWLMGGKSK